MVIIGWAARHGDTFQEPIFRSCLVTEGEVRSGEVAYWLRVRGCYCCWWLERIWRQFGNLKLKVRMFLCELCWRVIEVLSVKWRIRNRWFHSRNSVVVTLGASNNNGRSWQKYKLYKVTYIEFPFICLNKFTLVAGKKFPFQIFIPPPILPPGATELPAEPNLLEWLQQFRN